MTLARLLALWAVTGGSLWLHALSGIPGDYLGQGYPLSPGLKVSLASLGFDAMLATSPIVPAAAVFLWLHLRWLLPLSVAAVWLWAASAVIWPFVIDFGTTWSGTDAFVELFLHPVLTPLALGLSIAVAWYVSATTSVQRPR